MDCFRSITKGLSRKRLKCPKCSENKSLITVLLYCEQQFKRVKGFAGIAQVIATIEAEQAEPQSAPTKKAA